MARDDFLQVKDLIRSITPSSIRRLTRTAINGLLQQRLPRMDDPDCYVGTDEVSGRLQFELLRREGCRPESKVLEIGCGNLHGAVPLIRYLEKGNYVGVDPNEWLREAAMKKRRIRSLVEKKCARFLSVDDFDASELGICFDFVLSHSVLSHSADWQLELFLRNVGKVLAPAGRILASIRLAEGNRYGSTGTPDREDSKHKEWQYPDVTWFKLGTVERTANALGLEIVHAEEYTEFYTQRRPKECHDWLVVHRKPYAPS
jgi:SAM-dependent methyltransferase